MAGLDFESIIDAVEDEVRTEIAGGEDAFVSAIYEMTHHLKTTRFAASAHAYVERLAADTGYLDTVRDDWKKRSVSGEKLPGNDQLLERLREAAAT